MCLSAVHTVDRQRSSTVIGWCRGPLHRTAVGPAEECARLFESVIGLGGRIEEVVDDFREVFVGDVREPVIPERRQGSACAIFACAPSRHAGDCAWTVGRKEFLQGIPQARRFSAIFALLGLQGERFSARALQRDVGILPDGVALVLHLGDERLGELANADAEPRRLGVPVVGLRVGLQRADREVRELKSRHDFSSRY